LSKNKIEDLVYKITEPIAKETGCELVEVNFKKEGSNWFLRVFIDKEDGISINDCEEVSKKLGNTLDEIDPITQSYILEVSSLGINRPLKTERDFLKFIGNNIEIKLYKPILGSKKIEGILEGYDGDIIKIKTTDGQMLKIDVKQAAKVVLSEI
jgi:ribosome maturation factor RimP